MTRANRPTKAKSYIIGLDAILGAFAKGVLLWTSFYYVLFLIYSFSMVPSGDDWGFAVNSRGQMGTFGQAYLYFKSFHQRLFGHWVLAAVMNQDPLIPFYRASLFASYSAYAISATYFVWAFFGKFVSKSSSIAIGVSSLVFFLTFQGRPSETYFWFSQICNYMFPIVFFLLSAAFFQHSQKANGTLASMLFCFACFASLFGMLSAEAAVFFLPSLSTLWFLFLYLKRDKRWLEALRFFSFNFLSFLFAITAPGITARNSGQAHLDVRSAIEKGFNAYSEFVATYVFVDGILMYFVAAMAAFAILPKLNHSRSYSTASFLALLSVGFSVFYLVFFVGCYVTKINTPVNSRASVPLTFYMISTLTLCLFFLTDSLKSKKLTLTLSRYLPSLKVRNIALRSLSLAMLVLLLIQIRGSPRLNAMLEYMPKLGQFAKEQEYRINLIEKAVSNQEQSVVLPKLTSRPPFFFWDIEDADQYGFATYYASTFLLRSVSVQGSFVWGNGRILDHTY